MRSLAALGRRKHYDRIFANVSIGCAAANYAQWKRQVRISGFLSLDNQHDLTGGQASIQLILVYREGKPAFVDTVLVATAKPAAVTCRRKLGLLPP